MDDLRLDNLIDEALSSIEPVEVPKDLHFDAAKIMKLAEMQEKAEAEARREEIPAAPSVLVRLRQSFQNRSWTRYAAAAAAFAILLGVYSFFNGEDDNPLIPPVGDPTHTAEVEIDDGSIPLATPDEDIPDEEPDDPVTDPQPEQEPDVTTPPEEETPPAPPPVQSADNPKPPAPRPPVDPSAPVQDEQPAVDVEEETEDPPVEGSEYAEGLEIPAEDPEEPTETQEAPEGEEPPAPQEDILGSLFSLAMQNESFAESINALDAGFGYKVLKAEDVPDGTQFMVYFYASEEESTSETVNEDEIRSVLWKRESL